MEKRQRLLRLHFLALFTFLLCISPGIKAVVIWTAPNNTPDVINDDLEIDGSGGEIMLTPGGVINIFALTTDITITVTGGVAGVATVVGNDTIPSCLNLVANPGFNITLDFTGAFDLTFLGSADAGASPLLIFTQGEVDVLISGGRTLTLGSGVTGSGIHGGTQWWVVMQNTPPSIVNFNRDDLSPLTVNLDSFVVIARDSVLSYAAGPADTTNDGIIQLCGTNSGTGRPIMLIQDGGSFVVAGHTLVPPVDDCTTVDRTTPSGGNAILNITADMGCNATPGFDPHFYWAIQNQNTIWPELLVDPFFTQGALLDPAFIGTFNGLRFGFVLGAEGILNVNDGAYLWYEGQANNVCPDIDCVPGINCPEDLTALDVIVDCPCDNQTQTLIKPRNPSAFIVDGSVDPDAAPAQINLGVQSGIFFLSTVDANGNIVGVVPPEDRTAGAGEIVFDVEGPLDVLGSNIDDIYNSQLQILSLEVDPFGGPLFPEGTGDTFPLRTFAVDSNGDFLAYNKAAWLINNRMNLVDTSIAHTDENHLVCQSNDTISEPSYIGGEQWLLSQMRQDMPLIPRPEIAFYNSRLHLYTSAAFTGVDLAVPDLVSDDTEFANLTKFIFYSNGRIIDNGTGRTLILGTLVGSQACDGCTVISRDAHLNVMQDVDFTAVDDSVIPFEDEQLWFTVSTNNDFINDDIDTDITGQTSIHEIYLGGNSNISIGEHSPDCISQFTMSSTPRVWIAGNFFNFSTRGGSVGIPETSNVTGQGGIFVDLNGGFGIFPNFIASISTMVTKSCNGFIDLPKSQVVFSPRVGIANWNLVLTPPETVIVQPGEVISDYTLDWVATTKDFDVFIPYEIGDVTICNCPPVIPANITALPTIQGTVDQFQIVDSRIGDPAHILIDGGYIKELLWLSNCRPGEAATAVVILQNGGQLGINTAHRNIDSINAETVMGVNGIMLIANGDGRIDLNSDIIINNICSILQGPDWTDANVLEFRADGDRFIVVTKEGTLDLRSFTNGGLIRIGENVRLVLEPGARLILGGAVLELSDNASIEFEFSPQLAQLINDLDATVGPINNALNPLVSFDITTPHPAFAPLTNYGDGLRNTDDFRIRIMGEGTLRLRDQATAFIGVGAIVGVETLFEVLPDESICEIPTTNVVLELLEADTFKIGFGDNEQGGVFQVGNVENLAGHTVNFTLRLNGDDAEFIGGAGAFVGFGAGVVRPALRNEPTSSILADVLFNVGNVLFDFIHGNFEMDRVFNSDDPSALALVIGNADSFQLNYIFSGPDADDQADLRSSDFATHGGGNMFLITAPNETNAGAVALINLSHLNPLFADADDIIPIPFGGGTVNDVRLRAGLLASTDLLFNDDAAGLTPLDLFETWKVLSATVVFSRSLGLSTIAPVEVGIFRESRTHGRLGYVDRGFIGRQDVFDIIDAMGGSQGDRRARAYDNGGVNVQISTATAAPAPVLLATQIQE